MSDKDDSYYARQARDAKIQADRAISPDHRAAWLRLAEDWLRLFRREPAVTTEEIFD